MRNMIVAIFATSAATTVLYWHAYQRGYTDGYRSRDTFEVWKEISNHLKLICAAAQDLKKPATP